MRSVGRQTGRPLEVLALTGDEALPGINTRLILRARRFVNSRWLYIVAGL